MTRTIMYVGEAQEGSSNDMIARLMDFAQGGPITLSSPVQEDFAGFKDYEKFAEEENRSIYIAVERVDIEVIP